MKAIIKFIILFISILIIFRVGLYFNNEETFNLGFPFISGFTVYDSPLLYQNFLVFAVYLFIALLVIVYLGINNGKSLRVMINSAFILSLPYLLTGSIYFLVSDFGNPFAVIYISLLLLIIGSMVPLYWIVLNKLIPNFKRD